MVNTIMLKTLSFIVALSITNPAYAPETGDQVVRSQDVLYTIPHDVFELNTVRKLHCGDYTGTGVLVRPNLLLTASHVVHGEAQCWDQNGSGGIVVTDNPELDYSLLYFPAGLPQNIAQINCKGYVANDPYLALGWEHGEDFVGNVVLGTDVIMDITVGDKIHPHITGLQGRVVQGMSGGPIINLKGEVTGISNVTNYNEEKNEGTVGFSRPLSETPLCK